MKNSLLLTFKCQCRVYCTWRWRHM